MPSPLLVVSPAPRDCVQHASAFMSFFLPSPSSDRPQRTSRLLRPALTVVAMSLALSHAALPAVAANAVAFGEPRAEPASSAAARIAGVQSLSTPSEARAGSVERPEYVAEAPAPAAVAATGAQSIALSGRVVWPYDHEVPSNGGFGPRSAPCDGCSSFHDGMDFGGGNGTPIQAIADGTVVTATDNGGGYGSYVEIQHVVDGRTITSLYAHMQYGSLGLSVGESVAAGQFVGLTGTTGQSTGPHLHLELFYDDGVRIDPEAWLSANAR